MWEGHALLLSAQVRFRRKGYFVSLRGAERHPVRVVGIVVVIVAVGVDIVEVRGVVGRTKPPVRGRQRDIQRITFEELR